jgi:hypothetical protein
VAIWRSFIAFRVIGYNLRASWAGSDLVIIESWLNTT